MKLASQLNPDIFVQFRSCIFPIHNFQKIKTNGKISSQQNSSNGGVEGEVVLDQLNFAEVKEIVDALNFRQIKLATSRVEEDDKTEANDKQGVTEEPKYLEWGLFVGVSYYSVEINIDSIFRGGKPVLNIVLKGRTKK